MLTPRSGLVQVFLRAWVAVDLPKLYNPVTNLLGPAPAPPEFERTRKRQEARLLSLNNYIYIYIYIYI